MEAKLTALDNYKAHVERFFEEASPLVISNKDRDHAAVIVSALFKTATGEVCLFCHNLSQDFYSRGDVVATAVDAVARGVSVRILTQEEPEAIGFVTQLFKAAAGANSVQLRVCKPEADSCRLPYNFAVVDGKAFRIEVDRSDAKALACANDTKLAGQMLHQFNQMFEHGEAPKNSELADLG